MKAVYIFLLTSAALACWECREPAAPAPVIPAVWVLTNDTAWQQQRGVLYYHRQPFCGYRYGLYANGDTASITPYYEGRANGLAREWYQNRQLKETRWYVNGEKTGEHRGWWPNGIAQFVYHFRQDVFHGVVQEWYANGQRFRHMQYVNGHENGLQQIWQPNGSLFANYEVRNGRNYGLTGTMHCKNQWTMGKRQ
jgi:antitoxin component YwqK of YwqJK toxin-antitoxin module